MGRNSGKYGRKTAVIEELLREIHECKIEYKEAEIIIFDAQSRDEKKDFDHNTVA